MAPAYQVGLGSPIVIPSMSTGAPGSGREAAIRIEGYPLDGDAPRRPFDPLDNLVDVIDPARGHIDATEADLQILPKALQDTELARPGGRELHGQMAHIQPVKLVHDGFVAAGMVALPARLGIPAGGG